MLLHFQHGLFVSFCFYFLLLSLGLYQAFLQNHIWPCGLSLFYVSFLFLWFILPLLFALLWLYFSFLNSQSHSGENGSTYEALQFGLRILYCPVSSSVLYNTFSNVKDLSLFQLPSERELI